MLCGHLISIGILVLSSVDIVERRDERWTFSFCSALLSRWTNGWDSYRTAFIDWYVCVKNYEEKMVDREQMFLCSRSCCFIEQSKKKSFNLLFPFRFIVSFFLYIYLEQRRDWRKEYTSSRLIYTHTNRETIIEQ